MTTTALTGTALNKACEKMTLECCDFMRRSVTPFHCVDNISSMLLGAGFTRLKESDKWPELALGGKFFVTRNDSSIIAFTVGGKWAPGNGIKIAGAHTDSPNLQLKPRTFSKRGADYQGIGTQLYGGGLWHTWFDRDLTVAGRVVLQRKTETRVTKKNINLVKPILRVPNLAIHLQEADERGKFAPNKQTHVAPIIATDFMAESEKAVEKLNDHNQTLLRLIAQASECDVDEILDFDLSIVDTQDPVVGGAYDEFIFSPRIDNLLSCYCCAKALVDSAGSVPADDMVRVIAFFDNEEVGSASAQGAAGSMIPDIVERLHCAAPETRAQTIANSLCFSVDGVHGVHPNYAERSESEHRPLLHRGPAVKYNANQRYGTTGTTAGYTRALARLADVPLQQVCVKNDSPCGSTIGPIMSTLTGIPTVDLGAAMLSMHSVREMAGTVDVTYLTRLVTVFFERFQEVRAAE